MQLEEIRAFVRGLAPQIYNELKEHSALCISTPYLGLFELPGTKNKYKVTSQSVRERLGGLVDCFQYLPQKEDSMLIELAYRICTDANASLEVKKYLEPILAHTDFDYIISNNHQQNLHKIDFDRRNVADAAGKVGEFYGHPHSPVYFEVERCCISYNKVGCLLPKKVPYQSDILCKVVKKEIFNDLFEEISKLAKQEGNTVYCIVNACKYNFKTSRDEFTQCDANELASGRFVQKYIGITITLNKAPKTDIMLSAPKCADLSVYNNYIDEGREQEIEKMKHSAHQTADTGADAASNGEKVMIIDI